MANDMLSGLLNQTAGGNFWKGTSPTSGYGSFAHPVTGGSTVLPAEPAPTEVAPGAGTEAVLPQSTQPAQPVQPQQPQQPQQRVNPNQGYADMLQRQLLAAQNNLQMMQQMYGNSQRFNDQSKVQRAQQEVMRLQGEIRNAALKASQAGY